MFSVSLHYTQRSVCTRVVYSNRQLSYFLSTFGTPISTNPDHRFVFYANSRDIIDKCVETYGGWIDKSLTLQSDYLKIVGTMKKEENFHSMKLFCKDRNMSEYSEDIFNQ